jgi:hypothetical protein
MRALRAMHHERRARRCQRCARHDVHGALHDDASTRASMRGSMCEMHMNRDERDALPIALATCGA